MPVGGINPPANVLMVSSPHNDAVLNECNKIPLVEEHVFPLWSRAELALAGEHVFGECDSSTSLPSKAVRDMLADRMTAGSSAAREEGSMDLISLNPGCLADRLCLVGNVPRWLFAVPEAHDSEFEKTLSALHKLSEGQLISLLSGNPELGDTLSNKVLHWDCCRTGLLAHRPRKRWRLASPYVAVVAHSALQRQ